jgi:hypothetical protein
MMDALAAFGSLVITEGASAVRLVGAPDAPAAQWSAEERRAVDAVFTAAPRNEADAPLLALLVAGTGAAALTGVALDEARSRRDEEDDEETPKPAPQPRTA